MASQAPWHPMIGGNYYTYSYRYSICFVRLVGECNARHMKLIFVPIFFFISLYILESDKMSFYFITCVSSTKLRIKFACMLITYVILMITILGFTFWANNLENLRAVTSFNR